ncbi:hypothetical protein P389DRAFT_73 [Cystobasidium minutum MCA 4210]|uniref:uncharacterized protein n=1 Tax=Cystobasidium minutum MCA 4210 TaxID=1397322 RepID=UPI0034CE7EB3|eukprot:jgi/Rhomi1/73/CE72_2402
MASTDSSNGVPASSSPEHELKRETAYPQYLPSTGIGSKMRGESSGQGVLTEDGVERTRENTPVHESVPSASSTSTASASAGDVASNGAAVVPLNNGAGPNSNLAQHHQQQQHQQSNGVGREDSRTAVNRQYSGDKHDAHPKPVSSATSSSSNQQHPSYFPPFNSTSNGTSTTTTPPSKPTFPNSLANSRDKSSLLGHATPPHPLRARSLELSYQYCYACRCLLA